MLSPDIELVKTARQTIDNSRFRFLAIPFSGADSSRNMIPLMNRLSRVLILVFVSVGLQFGTSAAANESYASLDYFEDTFNSVTSDDLPLIKFEPSNTVINRSFGTHTHWLKLTVLESSEEPLVLRVKPTYLDRIELYAERNGKIQLIETHGDTQPGSLARSNDLAYRFKLDDQSAGAVHYLKINTSSNVLIAAEVLAQSAASEKKNLDIVLIGTYIGISLVFFIVSIVLFYRRRTWLSFLLVAGIFFGAVSSLFRHGAIDFLISQTLFSTSRVTTITTAATMLIFIQFLAEFLKTEQDHHRLFKVITVLVIAVASAFFVQLIMAGQIMGQHVFLIGLLNYLLAAYVFISVVLRQEALTIKLVSSLLMILGAYNIGINLELISASELDLHMPFLRNLSFYFFLTYLFIKIYKDEEVKKRNLLVANETKALIASNEKNRRFELEKIIGLLLHEIKTPLAIIQLAVDNLKSESEHLAPQSYKRLHRIADATDQINAVIVKSAELERSNFQRELEVSKVNLAALIDKVVTPLDLSRVTVRCDQDIYALTNEFTLEVILKNLVDNALKHSPLSSPITLSVASMTSQLSRVLCLTIGNQALPSQKELILNKFRSSLETDSGKNLGLGLWLVTELGKTLNLEISSEVTDHLVQIKLLIPGCPSNSN
jgi:two-component system, sensor histidine kinase LadS